MANSQQMDHVLRGVECVNNAVVADSQTEAAASSEPVMWKSAEAQAHFVNALFNAASDSWGKFEERCIEPRIINLERCAHSRNLRLAHARLQSGFHFSFRIANLRFEFRGEFQLVFHEVIKPLADLSQFGRREFFQVSPDLLNLAHANIMPQDSTDFNHSELVDRSLL